MGFTGIYGIRVNSNFKCMECCTVYETFKAAAACHYGIGGVAIEAVDPEFTQE